MTTVAIQQPPFERDIDGWKYLMCHKVVKTPDGDEFLVTMRTYPFSGAWTEFQCQVCQEWVPIRYAASDGKTLHMSSLRCEETLVVPCLACERAVLALWRET